MPTEVLSFWFQEVEPKQWFASDAVPASLSSLILTSQENTFTSSFPQLFLCL